MWQVIGYIRIIIILYLYGTILLGVVRASASVTRATGVIWDLNHSGICRAPSNNISDPKHSKIFITGSNGIRRCLQA